MNFNLIWRILITMKLVLILSVLFMYQAYGKANAQTVTLSCENSSIKSIFKEINRQTGYEFFYSSNMLEDAQPVSVTLKEAPLSKALESCFENQPFSYAIKGKTIVVTPALASQVVTIKGTVTDKNRQPLIGANVHVKGTQKGAATDLNGHYSIEVPINATLVFSFIGFKKQEIVADGQTQINIVLEEEDFELSELTFYSTGYQKIKPEQSTGSLSVIKAREFDTRVNTTDFLAGLQNKIPGLLINNDIQFEENSLFQIRGVSTIYGNRQPLIVVDGFPTELSLDMINPNEIESITVLKDAAAATVYGSRSSNGVIIIERKKAQIGKPKINFRSTISVTPKENYSRYRWDKEGSKTITEWEKINPTSLVTDKAWDHLPTLNGQSYNLNPAVSIMANWKSPLAPITIEERDRQLAQLASYNNTNDYAPLFLRAATTQTYNLDISGGNESVRYYITTNYSNTKQTQIKNDQSLFRLSGRTTVDITNRLSLDLTTDFNVSDRSNVPVPNINDIYTYERFQDNLGNPLSIHHGSNAHPIYNDFLMRTGLHDNLYYPLQDIHNVSDNTRSVSNRITANFGYKFTDNFNVSFGGVYESMHLDNKHLANENSAEARQYMNRYTTGTVGKLILNVPQGGVLKQGSTGKEGFTLRAQLNYNKNVADNHVFNIILGGEVREIIDQSKTAAFFGYDDLTLFTMPVDFRSLEGMSSATYGNFNPRLSFASLFNQGYENNRFVSAYSNLVYSYKRKYSLTGSIRIDQSNLFGTNPKYKYKPLWSVGAAWNIHREGFMENLDFVNSMKLRVAYGFNGNVAKNALPQVIAQNGLNSLTPSEVTQMLSLFSYANSGLKWEQTQNFNVGLDMKLFNVVNLNLDYYIKKSTDILATNQIDATKGGSSALINKASIRNKGFEIDLDADWIKRRTLNWNTGLIFSYNTSKVLDVYNPNIITSSQSRNYISGSYSNYLKDYSVGAVFALRHAGVDNEGHPLAFGSDGVAKRYFTKDQGVDELEYLGSSIPVFNTGLSNRVDVGNFYLYCMVHFYGGFKTRVPSPNINGSKRPLEGASNYWKQAGDEAKPDILPFPNNSNAYYLNFTDKYTVNGAYLTLGDLTASYSFRESRFVKNSGIDNLELRLQASNIYTVGFNKYNFSKATRSFEKSYMTPTYTLGLYVNF